MRSCAAICAGRVRGSTSEYCAKALRLVARIRNARTNLVEARIRFHLIATKVGGTYVAILWRWAGEEFGGVNGWQREANRNGGFAGGYFRDGPSLGTLDFEPEAYAELVQIFGYGVRAGVDQSPALSAAACTVRALLERVDPPGSKPGLRQRCFDGALDAHSALHCLGNVQLVRHGAVDSPDFSAWRALSGSWAQRGQAHLLSPLGNLRRMSLCSSSRKGRCWMALHTSSRTAGFPTQADGGVDWNSRNCSDHHLLRHRRCRQSASSTGAVPATRGSPGAC